MAYAVACLFVIAAWWFSTGAVLYLVGKSRQPVGIIMVFATLASALALIGLWITSVSETPVAAFCAFSCALVLWAWAEISFLTGVVTGSRRAPCPANPTGWERFVFAAQTLIYHELAIVALMGLVVLATWSSPNDVGLWTFAILWIARLSAKLNVFFGVPNLTEEFLPRRLEYLKSYFRTRPMNLFFPLSVTVSTLFTVLMVQYALAAEATAFEVAGWSLLATLMALVVIEHWFLVLPLPAAALWSWGVDDDAGNTPNARTAKRPADETSTALAFLKQHYRVAGNA